MPNPDISHENIQIVQVVQEIDKSCFCSLSFAFNESTNSELAIPPPFNTQYTTTSDLAKLYNKDIE